MEQMGGRKGFSFCGGKLTVSDLFKNDRHILNFFKTHVAWFNFCGNFCNGHLTVSIYFYLSVAITKIATRVHCGHVGF